MRRLLRSLLPYDPYQKWYTNLVFTCTAGFMTTFCIVMIVFLIPFFVMYLGFLIGDSAVRGCINRWNLYTKNTPPEDNHWWDSLIHLALWSIGGSLLGMLMGGAGWSIALSIVSFIFAAFMEAVYATAGMDGVVSVPSDRIHVYPNTHSLGCPGGGHRSSTYWSDTHTVKPKTPWGWVGYQEQAGPKEDVLFQRNQ